MSITVRDTTFSCPSQHVTKHCHVPHSTSQNIVMSTTARDTTLSCPSKHITKHCHVHHSTSQNTVISVTARHKTLSCASQHVTKHCHVHHSTSQNIVTCITAHQCSTTKPFLRVFLLLRRISVSLFDLHHSSPKGHVKTTLFTLNDIFIELSSHYAVRGSAHLSTIGCDDTQYPLLIYFQTINWHVT
jgi:hypothetical protein